MIYHEKIDENITKEQVLALDIPNSTQLIEDSDFPFFECEYQLVFNSGLHSITPLDFRFEKLFRETAHAMDIELDKEKEVFELIDEETYNKLCQSTVGHHCGGYPFFTQDDPRYDEKLAGHTILLLQIDSEGDISWGDAGVGNFFITLDDLRKKDFSRVLYHWDCV